MGKKICPSAGTILYRWPTDGGIEILAGERQKEPERGRTIIAFGGLIVSADKDVPSAALREAWEETGCSLGIKLTHLIKNYGPYIFRHELIFLPEWGWAARNTGVEIDLPDLFAFSVYAGKVVSGAPRDNAEIQNLRWTRPEDLAASDTQFAFEQALILSDFWHKYLSDPTFHNPKIRNAIHASAV